jgi:hypothetical protein
MHCFTGPRFQMHSALCEAPRRPKISWAKLEQKMSGPIAHVSSGSTAGAAVLIASENALPAKNMPAVNERSERR